MLTLRPRAQLICTLVTIGALLAGSRSTKADRAVVPTYSQVNAILAKRCISCHDAREADGELVMETYATLMKGGENGPDIIAGNADESPLVKQLQRRDKPFMPPPKKAPQLPSEEIDLIRAWINAGARGPQPGEIVASIAASTRPSKVTPKVEIRKPVLSLAFDPHTHLTAAARPGAVEIWSAEQQRVVHRLAALVGDVYAVAFSEDGTRLFAAGGDPGVKGRLWIWSVPEWKPLAMLEGHTDAIYSLAVSPDGKELATGSYDQKILIWNIADGKKVREMLGHNGAVLGVAFRPDGKILASVSADRTLKLWDVATANRLDTRIESQKDLDTVVWSPDGSRVAAAGVDNRIRVWKVSESAVEGTNSIEFSQFAHDGTILRMAWSADGSLILSGADNGTVRLFNAKDMSQKLEFPKQRDWPSALAFGDQGKSVIVGRVDGSIGFYDTSTGTEIKPPKPLKPVVTRVEPRGIERGATTHLRLTGQNLSALSDVTVSGATGGKVTARLLESTAAGETVVEVQASADVRSETVELSVSGAGGTSAESKLFVEDLPQFQAQRPNHLPADAQHLKLPISAWGILSPANSVDYFTFVAKKGEAIICDVAAKRLGSKAQVQLTLSNEQGQILATNAGTADDIDPLLAFKAPADGQFLLQVADLASLGKEDSFYRLSIGAFAYVTGVFPLGVPANVETRVQLLGYNLAANASVNVKGGTDSEVEVPIDRAKFRSRRSIKVLVNPLPELVEDGSNLTAASALQVPVPASANARILQAGDVGYFRFSAKAGATYAIETLAARRGSPMDTKIQVLTSDGRPVKWLQLQAVRDSNITFRGFDSNGTGARFPNYLEMDLDQYVYMNGEVVRLFNYPNGPDSEYFFYTLDGKRRCYFGTTATAHSLDEKVYVVEPRPADEKLVPNGLPVFPIWYENDDDPDRANGSDSRLLFTAPANADYLVRVSDARQFGGEDYVYRLTVRPAIPDFTATVEGYMPTVPAGGGADFNVKLNRLDGFDRAVRVDISGAPEGFEVSSPIVIEAGQWEARGTLHASISASTAMPPAASAGMKITATATIDGKPVTRELADLKRPWAAAASPVKITLTPFIDDHGSTRATIAGETDVARPIVVVPGRLTPAWLRVERKDLSGILSFDARNFPHGVSLADVGLNGVQILAGQTERKVFIQCAPWVADMDRFVHVRCRDAGNPTTSPVLLQVRQSRVAPSTMPTGR